MISLRKYPYPYRAAFTICSDIDASTWRDFLDIHAFLNTDSDTPFGQGLSLEIGDSFWFYSDPASPEHAFAYFEPDCKTPSVFAEPIRHLVQTGWLDTLHSYGNFTEKLPFQRKLAEQAWDVCKKYDLKIPVWVNHGDCKVNTQDFGQYYGSGDDPGNAEVYHTDILTRMGVHFFWESEKHVTPVVGQNRPVSLTEAWWNRNTLITSVERLKNVVKIVNGYRNILRDKFSLSRIAMWEQDPRKNDLYIPYTLKDGQQLLRFNRYGHGRYDWSDDLPRLINRQNLQRLIDTGGASILYLHIGDRRDRSKPALTTPGIQALNILAEKANKTKEIFVTVTSRLLQYVAIQKTLKYQVRSSGNTKTIQITNIGTIASDDKSHPPASLQGITFYTENPETTKIRWKDQVLETVKNPKDTTGQASISIPWKPLQKFPVADLQKLSL